MENGYIRLSRSFFDNNIWKTARAFSSCEAWLDLIQSARFEATPTSSCIVGCRVTWGRGQYPASVRFLSKRWGRSERWVRSVLNIFRKEGMITTDSSQGVTIITLTNYEKYNPGSGQCDTASDTPFDTPTGLTDKELDGSVTQVATQQVTHPTENDENGVKRRHTPDTNKKKGEEYISRLTSTCSKQEFTTPSKKDSSSEESQKEPIDYDGLADLFNATFAPTPIAQVRKLTEARRKSVRARVEEYGRESVSEVFRSVLDSPFLLGQNKRGWVASFDWIFKKSNYIKILERQYAGRKNGTQGRRDSVSRLEQLAEAILNDTSAEEIY